MDGPVDVMFANIFALFKYNVFFKARLFLRSVCDRYYRSEDIQNSQTRPKSLNVILMKSLNVDQSETV